MSCFSHARAIPRLVCRMMMAQPPFVIVVDDDAGLLKSVARLLAHHGIESPSFLSAPCALR